MGVKKMRKITILLLVAVVIFSFNSIGYAEVTDEQSNISDLINGSSIETVDGWKNKNAYNLTATEAAVFITLNSQADLIYLKVYQMKVKKHY